MPTSDTSNRAKLVAFLESIRRPDVSLDHIGDDDGLVQSGLIDSLATLEIITFLETEFGIDFRAGGFQPGELRSLGSLLDLIERHSP